MDLSKLPRLSNSEKLPPPADAENPQPNPVPPTPVVDYRYADFVAPGGPEAWISFAMGALLLLMNPALLQYYFAPLTFAKNWSIIDENGNPLPYTKSVFFLRHVGLTAFCLVLMLDGIVMLWARKPAIIIPALILTLLTVAFNLGHQLWTMDQGINFIALVAVMYGVYIAIFQWRLLKMIKARGRA